MQLMKAFIYGTGATTGYVAIKLANEWMTLGRQTPEDKKIKRLIEKEGLFFDIPHRNFANSKQIEYRVGYGQETAAPCKARLTSAHVKVIYNEEKPEEKPLVEYKAPYNADLEFLHWDESQINEINDYCSQALKKMHQTSLVWNMMGFKTAAQKIMVESALTAARTYSEREQNKAEREILLAVERSERKRTYNKKNDGTEK